MQLFAVGHIKGYSSQKWGAIRSICAKFQVKKGAQSMETEVTQRRLS